MDLTSTSNNILFTATVCAESTAELTFVMSGHFIEEVSGSMEEKSKEL